MKSVLIKNGTIVTASDTFVSDIWSVLFQWTERSW